MSYSITITADSVAELAGRLLAMGAQLASPASAAPPTVTPAVRATIVDEKQPEAYIERAKEEVLYVSPAAEEAPQSDDEIVFEPKIEVKPKSDPKPQPKLDYVKDVAPLVLKLVEVQGRPAAEAVLAKFNVSRASELKPEDYGKFAATITALLGE